MDDFYTVVNSDAFVAANEICRRLGVSNTKIRQIEGDYPLGREGATVDRFKCMLQVWYDGNGVLEGNPVAVTYAVLFEVLEKTGYRCVSHKLRNCCKFVLYIAVCINPEHMYIYSRLSIYMLYHLCISTF